MAEGRGVASLVLLALAAAAAPGCGERIQPVYDVAIVGPIGVDPFQGATRVVLEAGGRSQEQTVTPGRPFDLSLAGLASRDPISGPIRLQAFDAAGVLVAHGETPSVELEPLVHRGIRIFVQAPGTLGRLDVLSRPRRDHFAVAATEQATGMGAVLLGTGTALRPDPAGPGELATDDAMGIYNPIVHRIDDGGTAAITARRRASAIGLGQGRVLLFGGDVPEPRPAGGFRPSADGAVYRLTRDAFQLFGKTTEQRLGSMDPGAPRAAAPLAMLDRPYAFGGEAGAGALATVVRIDLGTPASAAAVLAVAMAAPRMGHTVTTVEAASGGTEALIFGGAPAGEPVAERFQPTATPPLAVFDNTETGPGRRDHAAVTLPGRRGVLLIGGLADDESPLASATLYEPGTGRFTQLPGFLHTARAAFAAFIVDGDLVVAGGMNDAAGMPVATAEIFDVGTLARVAEVAAAPRARPAYAVLPNHSAVLIGGVQAGDVPSAEIEIYQPRR